MASPESINRHTRLLAEEHGQTGLLWCTALLIGVTYFCAYLQSYTPPLLYLVSVLALYASAPPKFLFSPRNVLVGFHTMFYAMPVMAAERYRSFDFTDRSVIFSYLMLITSYVTSYLTLFHSETWLGGAGWLRRLSPETGPQVRRSGILCALMTACALLNAGLLIQSSGGLAHWIADPARAFLGREGAGIYCLAFVMAMGLGSCTAGAFAASSRKWQFAVLYLLFVCACTPLLGGKGRVFTMLAFVSLPWTFCASVMSRSTLFLITGLFGSFTAITFLRNISWMTADDFLGYSLNYFDTFDFLVLSVSDFEPSWFQTLFLPFNKFLTPFGIGSNTNFYDMSNWLTSIYLPHIWAARCTVQWPVETDLYLSLHYVFGVPLLMLFMLGNGLIFNLAVRTRSVGMTYVSAFASFYMVTHLRGSLILWTDFYTIPYWVISFYLLKKLRMPEVGNAAEVAKHPEIASTMPRRPAMIPPPVRVAGRRAA